MNKELIRHLGGLFWRSSMFFILLYHIKYLLSTFCSGTKYEGGSWNPAYSTLAGFICYFCWLDCQTENRPLSLLFIFVSFVRSIIVVPSYFSSFFIQLIFLFSLFSISLFSYGIYIFHYATDIAHQSQCITARNQTNIPPYTRFIRLFYSQYFFSVNG